MKDTAVDIPGFDLLERRVIAEYNSVGLHLRHIKTGLEVIHLLNDDEENLFSFNFRTLPQNSRGMAHIIEHSVLCGSMRFPLKDPFLRLEQQSVKTFLNAMTFPDKTCFPASSTVRADYFNLMAVYGDAVFFPLLRREVFSQEGWHLELNEDGTPAIQGVVYNEMKGNYSSFDSVAGDAVVQATLPGTIYALDSGGDPLEIPRLSYEEFVSFHKKCYVPANCLLFLYGNIPTEEQLAFVQERFLDCFEENPCLADAAAHGGEGAPVPAAVAPFAQPQTFEFSAPAGEDAPQKPSVDVSWLCGDGFDAERLMECIFLCEVLTGHDGSPLTRALLECGLGEDITPESGMTSEMRHIVIDFGLRGVERENARKVQDVILSTLRRLADEGVSAADIASAVMSVDFSNREIKRAHGPYSLVLLRRALRGWQWGTNAFDFIQLPRVFDRMKRRIAREPRYIQNLIREIFIGNPHRALVVITPDPEFSKQREEKERAFAEELLAARGPADICADVDAMHFFQNEPDPPDADSLIPRLAISDLARAPVRIPIERETVSVQGGGVFLFKTLQSVNGIVYFDFCIPCDVLPAADYPYLPLFSAALTNCGWGGRNWADVAAEVACNAGGFSSGPCTAPVGIAPEPHGAQAQYCGRDYLMFRLKMMADKTEVCLDLLADCLLTTDFSDSRRVRDLALEYRNDMLSSVVPNGHLYASGRAEAQVSSAALREELFSGLCQLDFSARAAAADPQELAERFRAILSALRNAGGVMHITADEEEYPAARAAAERFARRVGLRPLQAPRAHSADEFRAAVQDSSAQTFTIAGQVGFAASAVPLSFAADNPCGDWCGILGRLLSSSVLWEEIRTKGGAYGAFASSDRAQRTFSFCSYSDPKPFASLAVYKAALERCAEEGLDSAAVEKAILSCYSSRTAPRAPYSMGHAAFMWELSNMPFETRRRNLEQLLDATAQDVQAAARFLLKAYQEAFHVVICGKNAVPCEISLQSSGKIVALPV